MKKILLSAFAILMLSTKNFSQNETHVNQTFRDNFGQPVFNPILNPLGLQWSKTIESSSGGLLTVAHTNISGQGENILLTKTDADGNVIFQTSSYNVSGTSNEYGIGICEDSGGNIYVCGTTDASGPTNYNGVILRYNASGSLVNSTIFSGTGGMNDIATDIKIHPTTGKLNVSVSNENPGSSYDYLVLEINPSSFVVTNQSSPYDGGANLMDIALGLEISTSGVISVIGGSQSSAFVSAYAVAYYNASLGFLSDARTDVATSPNDQPLAYKKDGNIIYITGKTLSGTTYNIKTVKINANYTIGWSVTKDFNGLDDIGNTIDVDPTTGDVIVGGLATRSGNITDMVMIRYNSSGTQVGSPYIQTSENASGNSVVKKLCTSTTGNVYFVAGEQGNSGFKQVVVGKLNKAGNVGWEKKVIGPSQDLLPSDVEVTSDGIYAISVLDSTTDHYIMTGYNELVLDTAKKYVGGKACWKKGEILVAFNPSAINKTMINNDQNFGNLSNFLTSSANTAVNNAFTKICRDCNIQALKIFNQKTTDTLTTTRQGENERMPSFWATLLLKLPSSITETQAQTVFNSIPNVVLATQLNNFMELTSVPNDSLYNTTQGSLHPVSPYTNGHINVEEAWDVATNCGSTTIKGGLFDTGVMFRHKDLGFAGTGFYADTSGSSKLQGWYFGNGFPTSSINNGVDMRNTGGPILSDAFLDPYDHGTKVAGIIGAKRNNTSGIAGIAGGGNVPTNPGTKLYSLNVAAYGNAHWLLSAYFEAHDGPGTRANPQPYAYGVDYSNHSYKLVPGWWPLDSFPIIIKQIHYANRKGVTFVASRGNDGINNYVVPATVDPNWAISVGGSNSSGTKWSGSSYGSGVDVIAPADTLIVNSTSQSRGYGNFSGTSSAAPHVSGVVALLMSYMNDANNPYMKLNPEDCDFIIQRSATDVGPTGYDSLNGYGRLNAGKALRMVEKPYHILYHFGTNLLSSYSITKSVYANWDTVHLTEYYENKSSPSVSFPTGKYLVKTFQINATVNHSMFGTDSLMYYWPRHSKSNVFALPTAQKKIDLHERVIINSLNGSSANLTGYVYQVKDITGTNVLGWWPCDTSFAVLLAQNFSIMEYSVLSKNKAVGIKENYKDNLNVNVFPNPASQQQTLLINCEKESSCTIELYDITGRRMHNVYDGKLSAGKNSINHTVAGLPNSMYIYIIKIDGKSTSRKFIKE